jgi:protein-L-isoaspartate(D-aspartate) O-methyltransferase
MSVNHHQARLRMVEEQISGRGIEDEKVLGAMRATERHLFIPEDNQDLVYRDGPVGIGRGQTISQPYLVALMSKALNVSEGSRVLEIGTGSGYQAAVLSTLGAKVHSIEIIEELSNRTQLLLTQLGLTDVVLHIGDGCQGVPEHAPYDGIMVTAAPLKVPPHLLEQLKVGGTMLIPIGERQRQTLWKITRTPTGFDREQLNAVLFVPMTGEASNR